MRDIKDLVTRETMSVDDLAHYYIGQGKGATGCN